MNVDNSGQIQPMEPASSRGAENLQHAKSATEPKQNSVEKFFGLDKVAEKHDQRKAEAKHATNGASDRMSDSVAARQMVKDLGIIAQTTIKSIWGKIKPLEKASTEKTSTAESAPSAASVQLKQVESDHLQLLKDHAKNDPIAQKLLDKCNGKELTVQQAILIHGQFKFSLEAKPEKVTKEQVSKNFSDFLRNNLIKEPVVKEFSDLLEMKLGLTAKKLAQDQAKLDGNQANEFLQKIKRANDYAQQLSPEDEKAIEGVIVNALKAKREGQKMTPIKFNESISTAITLNPGGSPVLFHEEAQKMFSMELLRLINS